MDAGRARFIGRTSELARLDAAVDVTRSGAFRLVVIGGEAGVGKTRLLEECLAGLDRERVLLGACPPLEKASVPYAPFVQALRTLVQSLEPRVLSVILGPARTELSRLLPELGPGRPLEPMSSGLGPGGQARLYELILGVVVRLAHAAPVVLAIEDIHWADSATRDLLGFLVPNLRRSPVLILVTVRSDELIDGHPVLPLLAELERLDAAERIELDRFARADVAALLLSLTGTAPTAATVDRILSRSDGNPFFVEQLVAAGESAAGLPARLTDTLHGRVGRVSETSREVLRAAAAAARTVDDELLAELTGLPPPTVEASLREAVAARIVVPAGDGDGRPGYVFRHALLREVVYDELHPSQRRRLHRTIASALQARAEQPARGVRSPAPSELAFHWEAAGEWPEALTAHLEAAAAAADGYAWAAAVHHYDRAIALMDQDPSAPPPTRLDRAEALHRGADAAFFAADHQRAIEWGRAAIDAIAAVDPSRAGAYHVRLRWYLWDAGDRAGAAASVQEALRLVPPDPPSSARAIALGQWASVLMHSGRIGEAAAAAHETLAVARAVGARADEAGAHAMLGWINVLTGRIEAGFAALREAVVIAEDVGDVSEIGLGYALIAHMQAFVDRPSDARDAALAGYEVVTRLGAERTYGGVLLGHAVKALIALGNWNEADRLVGIGFEHELVGRPVHWLVIQRGRLATLRGRWDAAAADFAAARAFESTTGGSEYGDDLLAAEAELAAWSGDLEAARTAVDTALQRPPDTPASPSILWLAAYGVRAEADEAARARAHRGPDREAQARVRAAEIVGRWPGPPETAVRLLTEAELERLEGRTDPTRWADVVTAWERAGRPFQAAEARYRQAQALLGAGQDRGTARILLSDAQATCVELRAEALGQEVARLARRARIGLPYPGSNGPASVESATAGPEPLTAREAEVLRLLAGGWTNRQIAEELFISPRTASVHVTNIFGKLGANSRVEAAAIAHRMGLAGDAPAPPDASASERGHG